MAGEREAGAREERLGRLGGEVLRASAAGAEAEADAAAEAPFLYARVRTRIEEERRRRREEGEGWLGFLGVAWRAVPAMALVAVFALGLFLSSGAGELASGFGDEALLGGGSDIEQVLFADARAQTDEDEVLSAIIGEEEGSR